MNTRTHMTGDNVSGEGAGDDERIDIDLDYMPDEVGALWIVGI